MVAGERFGMTCIDSLSVSPGRICDADDKRRCRWMNVDGE